MKKDKFVNQNLDPRLTALLDEMRNMPTRNPQEAGQRQSRYLAQVEQMIKGKVQQPKMTIFETMKENFNMSTPKLRTVLTAAAIMLMVFVFLFSSAGITAVVAAKSLPGDSLYGIKTGVERTRLNITSQEVQRVQLNLKYAQLRLDEIERLIAKGRFDDLAEAIKGYEFYVQNAISGLAVVAKNDPQAALELNSQVAALLGKASTVLAGYAAVLPATSQTPFTNAIYFSESAGNFRCKAEFTGNVEVMESEYWIISGYKVIITLATEIEDNIHIGDKVKVEAWSDMQGYIYAKEIDLDDGDPFYYDDDDDMEFIGMVEEIYPDYWMINGQRFEITTDTEFEDNIKVGDMVEVEYRTAENGQFMLLEVEFAFDDDDMYDDDMYDDDDDDDMYDDDDDDDMYDDDDDDMYDDDDDDMYDDDMDDDGYGLVYRDGDQYCTGEVTGVISGNLYVAKGETCTLNGAKIEGNIIVMSNAVLFVYSSSLEGNLEASYASQVEVHNNSYISGNVIIYNSGMVLVDYSQIYGNLEVRNNSGQINIKDNMIDGNLICYDNYTMPTGGNNMVDGNKEGQCADL